MDIDITDFFHNAEPFEFFASVAERGQNAGPETWQNAVEEGTDKPLLTTPKQIRAWRTYLKGFGAWSDAEIAAWSDAECNALFIQYISGDIRELEALCSDDNGEVDWAKAEQLAQEGTIQGNIYPADDGKVYFSIEG